MSVEALRAHFPNVPVPSVIAAAAQFDEVFFDWPMDDWTRAGSCIVCWRNDVRIGFAPRVKYASIYFRGVDATDLYRFMGGACPSARVTINLPYDEEIDAELIRLVIARAVAKELG